MAGNLGLIVAQDIVSFYLGFAVMGLAAYGLIAHPASVRARRAARRYLAWTIAGELILFVAVVMLAQQHSGASDFRSIEISSTERCDGAITHHRFRYQACAARPSFLATADPGHNTLALKSRSDIKARALLLGDRLDLKQFKLTECLSTTPLTLQVDAAGGIAVLFRYGVIVLFGVPVADELRFIESLHPLLSNAYTTPEVEELDIHCGMTSLGVQSV